jgi:histidine decarboxylase
MVNFVLFSLFSPSLLTHLLQGVRLAQTFEAMVQSDPRFEIPAKRHLGLVVFRLIGDNIITETLWKRINSRGNIHCVPAILKGKYVIRFTVTSPRTTLGDIVKDWKEIKAVANDVLQELNPPGRSRVPLADTKNRNENFGTSLLLSNSPMSPKIVNGSFAAIYDQSDVIEQFCKTIKLRLNAQNSPGKGGGCVEGPNSHCICFDSDAETHQGDFDVRQAILARLPSGLVSRDRNRDS